ncbi:TrbI/VirB10 family protein [Luteibacter sp. PPL201]|uniref:TrbI/VirB10 family protein n=1 Tax=Luteibacter sahnii TaxID=3021977 RepID=A0ABT6B7I2_9GAMM|nr:TrbI/VirB10 family protein [Luteibacter sp. PPL193]MDY1547999.1 TrbI/VirB10 family protein [Luteibacter sp. PPL193]
MSPNNPYHPDDESARGNTVPPHDERAQQQEPLSGNPYAANQQRQAQPDLDAAAPQLAAADVRRMNRRAIAFLAGIVVLLLAVGYFLLTSGSSQPTAPPKAREETVTVPAAPKPLQELPPPQPAQPIALAPPPPLPTPEQTRPAQMNMPSRPAGPTLLERRIAAAEQSGAAVAGGPLGNGNAAPGPGGFAPGYMGPQQLPPQSYNGVPINTAYGESKLPDVSSAEPLTHPDTLMLRGTFIRCTLETKIITDIPGFTSCIVTEPVYSFTGKRLLLPKGSKVLGKYAMEPNGPRVAVIWDRIVTPTGIDVNMASPGIDTLGGAGHPGIYNAHWGSRIGSALLISLFSDAFKYEAAEHGPRQTTISNGVVTQSPFESNTAQTLQNLANSAVARAANRPATVTINQGTVLDIYVAKDVDFAGVVARY